MTLPSLTPSIPLIIYILRGTLSLVRHRTLGRRENMVVLMDHSPARASPLTFSRSSLPAHSRQRPFYGGSLSSPHILLPFNTVSAISCDIPLISGGAPSDAVAHRLLHRKGQNQIRFDSWSTLPAFAGARAQRASPARGSARWRYERRWINDRLRRARFGDAPAAMCVSTRIPLFDSTSTCSGRVTMTNSSFRPPTHSSSVLKPVPAQDPQVEPPRRCLA